MVNLHRQGQKHVAKEKWVYIVAIFLCRVPNLHAQEFGTPWMHYPHPDTCSTVWFRNTYVTSRKPLSAFLSVEANGEVEVFVNETPLTPPFYNNIAGEDTRLALNIGKYLRKDSNTIAIHYRPAHEVQPRRGVGVCLYGRRRDGTPFAYFGGEGWMCRTGDIKSTDSLRECNGNMRGYSFYTRQSFDEACWMPPTLTPPRPTEGQKPRKTPISSCFSSQIVAPKYFDITENGVEYEFGIGFYGFVRVTLRGAAAGERIYIGDTAFTCRGNTDEQVCARFSPAYYRRVRITGDRLFAPIHIQRVEGINLSYIPNSNYYFFTDP